MPIQILPARLANQIAAGEVVERPASVIKELVENSLDAGADSIKIDIDKGGAKTIRISDNGKGIVKDELTLALSRHATSKISCLNDLEAISSLGFRGEALASISSVSRLTLTSKPQDQNAAWQACAEGRDMDVVIQPAAHPNGTTIEVNDLFFNTPARRKFLRTEKTEFNYIEEVIRRIALARFDVNFVLSHNGKIIRQYRAANNKNQQTKRVAQICGQSFINKALEVECQHGDMHLSGWLAKPEFSRNQNDLNYSYVNGRMMRDKLINHAIRQAYADLLPSDSYPAFVLFLTLDYREVDVNVHPAKHEVRFHQGRYVHDFITSVCQQALSNEQSQKIPEQLRGQVEGQAQSQALNQPENVYYQQQAQEYTVHEHAGYIKQLNHVGDVSSHTNYNAQSNSGVLSRPSEPVTKQAVDNYQALMSTPTFMAEKTSPKQVSPLSLLDNRTVQLQYISQECYGVIVYKNELRLLSIKNIEQHVNQMDIEMRWQQGLVSQPLLLPIKVNLTKSQFAFVQKNSTELEHAGIVVQSLAKENMQIRQFPAILREKDVSATFMSLLEHLMIKDSRALSDKDWQQAIVFVLQSKVFSLESAQMLFNKLFNQNESSFEQQLLLNSVTIDLTSEITQLR